MNMSEERMKILKLVEEGKISAEEAVGLIKALGGREKERPQPAAVEGGWVRIRVSSLETGETSVNMNLPMKLVRLGLSMGARFVPDVEGVELEELAEALQHGMKGKVMDVVDEDEGQRVEIFVE